jgi:hypothetical protein
MPHNCMSHFTDARCAHLCASMQRNLEATGVQCALTTPRESCANTQLRCTADLTRDVQRTCVLLSSICGNCVCIVPSTTAPQTPQKNTFCVSVVSELSLPLACVLRWPAHLNWWQSNVRLCRHLHMHTSSSYAWMAVTCAANQRDEAMQLTRQCKETFQALSRI